MTGQDKPTATIRTTPDDFAVEEIPAYEPSGAGEHLYVTFRKRGLDTMSAVRKLASALGVQARDAGTAGLKDRHAVTVQTASFPFPATRALPEAASLASEGLEVLSMARHGNKLRTGHLHGNRFRIVLRDLDPAAVPGVVAALCTLGHTGLPNWFGEQRFGRAGDNADVARGWLGGARPPPRDPRVRRLQFSALQSELFHRVLARRVADGTWRGVLAGDLVQLRNTNRLFLCTDAAADAPRAETGDITATGPLYGAKMRWGEGAPAALEREILAEAGNLRELLDKWSSLGEGARRPLRLMPEGLSAEAITEYPGSLRVHFVLPKGAYATAVLAEVCAIRDATRTPAPSPGKEDPEGAAEPDTMEQEERS
jgi:tRNA pseudouridine13 synthase